MGTVMGSKNLKAIVVRGSKTVKIANPQKAVEAFEEAMATYRAHPMREWIERAGLLSLVEVYAEMGILPVRGGQTGMLDSQRARAFAHNLHEKHQVTKRACFGCPVACVIFHEVREGTYAGSRGEKPELPAAICFSAFHDMPTIEYGIYMTDRCNIYGIDQIEMGAVIGMALYWYENGLITKKDTDGLELVWGNEEAAVKLFERILKREGIGAVLALGVKGAVDKMGPEYEPPQGSVKGVAEVMPDARVAKSFALGCAISPRGADHLKSSPGIERLPPEVTKSIVGSEKAANPLIEDDKYLNCAWSEDLKTFLDEVGICINPSIIVFGGFLPQTLAKLFSAITGLERTWEELKVAGERGWVAMRCFNAMHGLNRKDDVLPKGISTQPKPDGLAVGATVDLPRMLDDYYAFRGWDKNGVPTREKLEGLGMNDIADKLHI
jgi:aldehyde:ferredoxin oxidoreductase